MPRRSTRARADGAVALAAALLLATACAPGPAPTASPMPSAVSPSASPTPTPTPTPTCGALSRDEAAAVAVAELPAPLGNDLLEWDTAYTADDPGYDPCAALSWIALPLAGGTVSSPTAIALFHRGEYLGPATAEQYGFWPEVRRLSDASIEVVYPYLLDGDPNAAPQGRATAQFTWDEVAGAVEMTGEVPPG